MPGVLPHLPHSSQVASDMFGYDWPPGAGLIAQIVKDGCVNEVSRVVGGACRGACRKSSCRLPSEEESLEPLCCSNRVRVHVALTIK